MRKLAFILRLFGKLYDRLRSRPRADNATVNVEQKIDIVINIDCDINNKS